MAEFQPFSLGQVLQTAEAIKAARSQSTTDRLREQYLGEQINNMRSDRERQARQDEIVLGKEKAKEIAVRSEQILLRKEDLKSYVERAEPDLVKNYTQQGGDWAVADDKAIREMVTRMRDRANQELGVAPTPQLETMGDVSNPGGGVWQRNPTTGAITQVTAPQKTTDSGFTLGAGETRYGPDGRPIASAPRPAATDNKLPPGYRWTADGNMEAIPGGPADKSAVPEKPLPVGALRMAQDAREAMSVARGVDASLRRIYDQVSTGKLNLGPVANRVSGAKNWAGLSDENSRNYQTMMSSLEKLRNDTLRLNKGVQTEGDAQRAWNELLANVNDEEAVKVQLQRIMEINTRAESLQQENMDSIQENYGRTGTSQNKGASGSWGAPGQAQTINGFTVRRVK